VNFSSDNAYGAAPEILDALTRASTGAVPSYGDDPLTGALRQEMSRLFEREVALYPVVTGTAANALALATLCPQHGAIFCHADAHIATDECGAPEFYTHGAKLVTLEGRDGKLTPEGIARSLKHFLRGVVHHSQPSVISLTQASEFGTVYTRDEIAGISALAREQGLKLHMDGARFANALAHLGCTPAEATWKAGIDVLSFGATKNGAMGAEAVVVLRPDGAAALPFIRKQAMQLASKMRYVAAQFVAMLSDDLWRRNAEHANAMAARLAAGVADVPGVTLTYPVQSNAVFAGLPAEVRDALQRDYPFYVWDEATGVVRWMASFDLTADDVDGFVARLAELAAAR